MSRFQNEPFRISLFQIAILMCIFSILLGRMPPSEIDQLKSFWEPIKTPRYEYQGETYYSFHIESVPGASLPPQIVIGFKNSSSQYYREEKGTWVQSCYPMQDVYVLRLDSNKRKVTKCVPVDVCKTLMMVDLNSDGILELVTDRTDELCNWGTHLYPHIDSFVLPLCLRTDAHPDQTIKAYDFSKGGIDIMFETKRGKETYWAMGDDRRLYLRTGIQTPHRSNQPSMNQPFGNEMKDSFIGQPKDLLL